MVDPEACAVTKEVLKARLPGPIAEAAGVDRKTAKRWIDGHNPIPLAAIRALVSQGELGWSDVVQLTGVRMSEDPKSSRNADRVAEELHGLLLEYVATRFEVSFEFASSRVPFPGSGLLDELKRQYVHDFLHQPTEPEPKTTVVSMPADVDWKTTSTLIARDIERVKALDHGR